MAGATAVLASDPTLIRPDGSFISRDRRLYLPVKQPVESPLAAAVDGHPPAPFVTYSIALPENFRGIRLGGPVTGA
ncbi:MAG: hypothetical protein ACRDUX_32660 [Mycobacterium sp.]